MDDRALLADVRIADGRTADVIHTRPLLVEHRVVHVVLAGPDRSLPQYGDGCGITGEVRRVGSRTVSCTRLIVLCTGSISGTVVLEGAGTPVRRARVNLVGGELRGGHTSVTNDNGQFSFTGLPAGRFTMSVSKPGYVDIAYGAKRAGRPGTPIQLADAQKLEKANISMPRGSVVSGVVIDENGEPSPSTPVRVMRYVMRTGERTLQQSGNATTDDRGMYRIWGLQPGEYSRERGAAQPQLRQHSRNDAGRGRIVDAASPSDGRRPRCRVWSGRTGRRSGGRRRRGRRWTCGARGRCRTARANDRRRPRPES